MVAGLEGFQRWFADFSDQYTLIGGTACDLLMNAAGLDFRATKDIDMVLILESLTRAFGYCFWDYIRKAGYEHRNKSAGTPQFYRFVRPISREYPYMIELFSRRNDAISLPQEARLTPFPLDNELSSLSAILMNDQYYQYLRQGTILLDGVPILDAQHLIPFKAKAWLDLAKRKQEGEAVDERNIRKHKNDVFRLSQLLAQNSAISLPTAIHTDLARFLAAMETEAIDLQALGLHTRSQTQILQQLRGSYGLG